MLTEREKLETLTTLGIELNQVNDLDILMEHILTKARQFVNADAGSIYIREGDKLNFTYTQNDTFQARLPKGEKLIYSTFSLPINEKSIAGYVAATGRYLNMPDVYRLDPTLPYNFSKQFDQTTGYKTQSILTIPLKNSNDEILGILQIINALNESKDVVPFSAEDEKMMFHFASIAAVALERAQMTRAILLRMIRMAEMRDPKETGAHVNRVAGYGIEIYERWAMRHGVAQKEIDSNRDVFRMAAMLHDVGKVGISDLILKKPGRFEKDEYEIMKQHTVLGAQLFLPRQSDLDDIAQQIALNHHEWYNGNGYPGHVDILTGEPLPEFTAENGKPLGKQKDQIPIFGRIVSVSDVYDALSSARVYKKAYDEKRTLKIIEEGAGTQFDPEIIEIFFSCLPVLRSIQESDKDKL